MKKFAHNSDCTIHKFGARAHHRLYPLHDDLLITEESYNILIVIIFTCPLPLLVIRHKRGRDK